METIENDMEENGSMSLIKWIEISDDKRMQKGVQTSLLNFGRFVSECFSCRRLR